MDAFFDFLEDWVSFNGKIDRREFIVRFLCLKAAGLSLLGFLVFMREGGSETLPKSVAFIVFSIAIFILIADIATKVKRCHDLNKSGWFVAISLIPMVGPVVLFLGLAFLPSVKINNAYYC